LAGLATDLDCLHAAGETWRLSAPARTGSTPVTPSISWGCWLLGRSSRRVASAAAAIASRNTLRAAFPSGLKAGRSESDKTY
jgi:hypothetical protein